MVNIRNIDPKEFKSNIFRRHDIKPFKKNFFKTKKEALNYIKDKGLRSLRSETEIGFLNRVKENKIIDLRDDIINELRQKRTQTENNIFRQTTGNLNIRYGEKIKITPLISYLTLNIDYEINKAIEALEGVENVYVKLKILNILPNDNYSFSTTKIISDSTIKNNLIYNRYLMPESSEFKYCIGYDIFIPNDGNEDINITEYYKQFKAFSPTENIQFHKLTKCSTTITRICIYQTYFYLYINNSKKIKQNEKLINEALENETKEIKTYIKNGELINFLLAKIDDKNKYFIVEFFKKTPTIAIKITKEGVEEIKDINLLKNEKTFLYDNEHVAPRINDNKINVKKEKKFYTLHNTNIKDKEDKGDIKEQKMTKEEKEKEKLIGFKANEDNIYILAYDIEVYVDEKCKAVSYCICLSNGKSFYGIDCINEFCDYLASIKSNVNFTKTKQNKKMKKIYLYGFNNSRFDNLLIFNTLYNKNKGNKIEYVIAGSTLKFIKYSNISIFDLSLYYCGSLAIVAESFKLDIKKGVFPYKFVNENNINYIGDIPDLKYWESKEDLETYKKNYSNFDLKKYTVEYCLLDCKLVYEIAVRHLQITKGTIKKIIYLNDCLCGNCKYINKPCLDTGYIAKDCPCDICKKKKCQVFKKVRKIKDDDLKFLKEKKYNIDEYKKKIKNGEIKIIDKNYNAQDSPTGANIAIRLFNQVFQNHPLYNSPDDVQIMERLAYKGGRTEVFKQKFNDKNKTLFYKDINSSYPYCMTFKMPFSFIKKYNCEERKGFKFIDYNLYHARSEYNGNDKYFIPNLLHRSDKGDIIGVKNTPYGYHWGVELNEAIKNNCIIYYDEVAEYEGKEIFKEYAEYFYNERLKIKNSDAVKATFFKLLLNSLYGKFGQKPHGHKILCRNKQDIIKITRDKNIKIINFEELGSKILIEYTEINDKYSSIGNLVRFSSYIASCARTNLSIGMRDIGHNNIFYCDTDSIFHTGQMSDELIDNNKLGSWKDEEPEGIKQAYFFAPKTYFYTTNKNKQMKAKGVPKKYLTIDKINDLINKNIMSVEIGAMFFRSLKGVKIDKQIRTIKPVLNKRIWDDNNSKPYNNYEDWYKVKYKLLA